MNLPALPTGRMVYLEAIAVAIYQYAEQRPAGSVYCDSDAEWYRGYALLALAKGEAVTPQDIHDAWTAGTIRKLTPEGAAAHPFCVPYPELPEEVQRWDDTYAETIQGICRIARILQGDLCGS